jgi:hypothetical protein
LDGHSLRVGNATEMKKVDIHWKLRSLLLRVERNSRA